MKPNRQAVAIAVIALFTAGASATHLSRTTSVIVSSVVSLKADEGAPHDLLASNDCDEGMPPNLKAMGEDGNPLLEHRRAGAKHLASAAAGVHDDSVMLQFA